MDILIRFEREKKKFLNKDNDSREVVELLNTDKESISFFCGMCYRKCYQDNSSGLSFFKKVYVPYELSINSKYKNFLELVMVCLG